MEWIREGPRCTPWVTWRISSRIGLPDGEIVEMGKFGATREGKQTFLHINTLVFANYRV